MIEQKETLESTKLVDVVIAGMQEKKALNIVDLDLKSIKNAVCEHVVHVYIYVCTSGFMRMCTQHFCFLNVKAGMERPSVCH